MAAINKAVSYASGYFSKACEDYKPSLSCDSSNCIKSEEEVECRLDNFSYYYADAVKVTGADQYYGNLTCAFAGCLCEQACFNKPGVTPPRSPDPSPSSSPEPTDPPGHHPVDSILQHYPPASSSDTDSSTQEDTTTTYTYPESDMEDTTYSDPSSSDEGNTTYTYP
jgi:hypothetical protein